MSLEVVAAGAPESPAIRLGKVRAISVVLVGEIKTGGAEMIVFSFPRASVSKVLFVGNALGDIRGTKTDGTDVGLGIGEYDGVDVGNGTNGKIEVGSKASLEELGAEMVTEVLSGDLEEEDLKDVKSGIAPVHIPAMEGNIVGGAGVLVAEGSFVILTSPSITAAPDKTSAAVCTTS